MRCTFTNRTIGIGCFSIGTSRTIGTNGDPSVTRFPSAAVQPSQFWPHVYQVLQGPSSYTYPPVPFYGNPIERAQESLSVLCDVKSTQPHNILAHASPSLEFSSPAMVLALHQWLHEEKDESGSEFSSSTSGDSPFEIITLPASDSFHPLCDYSSLPEESFSGLLEPALETSLKAVMLHRSWAQVSKRWVTITINTWEILKTRVI